MSGKLKVDAFCQSRRRDVTKGSTSKPVSVSYSIDDQLQLISEFESYLHHHKQELNDLRRAPLIRYDGKWYALLSRNIQNETVQLKYLYARKDVENRSQLHRDGLKHSFITVDFASIDKIKYGIGNYLFSSTKTEIFEILKYSSKLFIEKSSLSWREIHDHEKIMSGQRHDLSLCNLDRSTKNVASQTSIDSNLIINSERKEKKRNELEKMTVELKKKNAKLGKEITELNSKINEMRKKLSCYNSLIKQQQLEIASLKIENNLNTNKNNKKETTIGHESSSDTISASIEISNSELHVEKIVEQRNLLIQQQPMTVNIYNKNQLPDDLIPALPIQPTSFCTYMSKIRAASKLRLINYFGFSPKQSEQLSKMVYETLHRILTIEISDLIDMACTIRPNSRIPYHWYTCFTSEVQKILEATGEIESPYLSDYLKILDQADSYGINSFVERVEQSDRRVFNDHLEAISFLKVPDILISFLKDNVRQALEKLQRELIS